MKLKNAFATVAAMTLVSVPVAAQAAAAEVDQARVGTEVEGENLRGGFIIPLIALIAIILGLCVATDICGGDDDDLPTSP